MNFTAKIKDIGRTLEGSLTLTLESPEISLKEVAELSEQDKITVEMKRYKQKRSLDANALMWVCLQKIAEKLKTDKWSVYLRMLKRYGQFTYICVKPCAVDSFKKMWRECEEIGEVNINGEKATQLLCYFGSSQYDTQEFSFLLDGIISEMKEMDIEIPCSEDMRRLMEEWSLKKNGE